MTTYTCNDYRLEMRLIGLKIQLVNANLTEAQKRQLEAEITKLEQEMQME